MYSIRSAVPADEQSVVDLVARLQVDQEHLIGYHGATREEVADELAGFRPDWAAGAVLAVDDEGAVRGVLSVDADPEVGRAWLHGPYVDLPDGHPAPRLAWQNTADDLLDAAVALPRLAGIGDQELYGHRRHRRLADFAARHGFDPVGSSRVFALDGPGLRGVLVTAAGEGDEPRVLRAGADPAVDAGVIALHERCFPSPTVTGRQLVCGDRGHTVLVLTGADGVIGYAGGFAQRDELYVDYVGVDPGMRSVGSGRALVQALLRALAAEHGARPRAAAVISLGNDASERMFTALGFTLRLELVGYRRK
ncbi:GNAT family N-acetyltransferase [Actinokineospora sp. G85]|uniref:GNAT family N-acetyltransferase n=1 Tax=Actinokineospora sp. G85 TaxID=3406626 RepID=UPI003C77BF42